MTSATRWKRSRPVLHPHVEGCGDGAFFVVAAHVQIAVGPAVGESVDQAGVAVEGEDDVFVGGEQGVVVGVAESVWVLAGRLQPHQVHHVDHPDLQLGQVFPKDRHGRQHFQSRRVSAARQDHIGLGALVVAGPFPDADALGAMHYCLLPW